MPESNPKSFEISPETRRFILVVAGLSLAFVRPLNDLLQLALSTTLYSHLPLIPIVSLYFAWERKNALPSPNAPNRGLAIGLALAAITLILFYWIFGNYSAVGDYLSIIILSYVLLIVSAALYCFGSNIVVRQSFALGFLVFLIPMPMALEGWINTFFQYTSAEASFFMLSTADIPVFRPEPLLFHLPTIEMHVAPSCSGIRSSLVLLITSIVAGELFLRSKWKRWGLAFFIIPLAIVRNGFRISTIGYLCVKVGPHMIDHWIHRRGGPLFFVLSLVPFFALLFWLWKREQKHGPPQPTAEDLVQPKNLP